MRKSFHEVVVEDVPDDDEVGKDQTKEDGGPSNIVDIAHELEVVQMTKFREKRLKELRQVKKQEMEDICSEEGITYVKLDQAKADVAEIRARRDYAAWLKEKDVVDDDEDRELHYYTSAEDVDDA
ncbi:hypothetical protein CBR_g39164 [Chara braunii]|uniref:Uncharacterized protein n=1 Tax=Chara braunii TaxID=69332 RepID=A0A388LR43_CHABU|nr:hypothetical protein CBR_g39164 [Chara braunii]|eukprot:GBG84787.1 hypothetical protein CBR_g39164 [Chara braunii]